MSKKKTPKRTTRRVQKRPLKPAVNLKDAIKGVVPELAGKTFNVGDLKKALVAEHFSTPVLTAAVNELAADDSFPLNASASDSGLFEISTWNAGVDPDRLRRAIRRVLCQNNPGVTVPNDQLLDQIENILLDQRPDIFTVRLAAESIGMIVKASGIACNPGS